MTHSKHRASEGNYGTEQKTETNERRLRGPQMFANVIHLICNIFAFFVPQVLGVLSINFYDFVTSVVDRVENGVLGWVLWGCLECFARPESLLPERPKGEWTRFDCARVDS